MKWRRRRSDEPDRPLTRDEAVELIAKIRRQQEKVVKYEGSGANTGFNTTGQSFPVDG